MTQRATREDLAWENAGTSRLSAPLPQAETVARPSDFYLDMLRREASRVMDALCMKTSANLGETMVVIDTLRAQLAAIEDLRRVVEAYELPRAVFGSQRPAVVASDICEMRDGTLGNGFDAMRRLDDVVKIIRGGKVLWHHHPQRRRHHDSGHRGGAVAGARGRAAGGGRGLQRRE